MPDYELQYRTDQHGHVWCRAVRDGKVIAMSMRWTKEHATEEVEQHVRELEACAAPEKEASSA